MKNTKEIRTAALASLRAYPYPIPHTAPTLYAITGTFEGRLTLGVLFQLATKVRMEREEKKS